ncbi:hypothetical protein ZOSMA_1G00840 [Zostera marina]|uniref:Uncharacterized protein n=1 Tax=Zostera marina TaxID=29655 RepID=A0A0K9PM49_ZOSMR|nr:hypothetical protein ZOSMA_1G00840 [Zostera marina]
MKEHMRSEQVVVWMGFLQDYGQMVRIILENGKTISSHHKEGKVAAEGVQDTLEDLGALYILQWEYSQGTKEKKKGMELGSQDTMVHGIKMEEIHIKQECQRRVDRQMLKS